MKTQQTITIMCKSSIPGTLLQCLYSPVALALPLPYICRVFYEYKDMDLHSIINNYGKNLASTLILYAFILRFSHSYSIVPLMTVRRLTAMCLPTFDLLVLKTFSVVLLKLKFCWK